MLNNVKIGHKLLLMVFTPILGLLAFSLWSVADHYVLLKGLTRTESLTRLAVKVGALAHEIQKERGYASGYMGAKGGKFREELARQQEKVDAEYKKLQAYLVEKGSDVEVVNSSVTAASTAMEQRGQVRRDIASLKLAPQEIYSYYTGLTNSYMDVIGAVAITSGNRDVMQQATAYYAFSKAKEEAGKLRATFNAVLATDNMDLDKFQRTNLILSSLKTYLEVFRKYGSKQAVAAFDAKANGETFRKVEEIQTAVLSKGLAGGFGIAPELWFNAISTKIDIMREVEDTLTGEILATAGGLASQAKTTLLASIAATVFLVVVTLFMAVTILMGITKPLSRMLAMLKDIAEGEGDLTKRLQIDRKDELGEVSLWFNRFVDNVHGIVSHLAKNTDQVSSSAAQLNATAAKIASAAEEVAKQSGAVATASEEMSATSNDISNNCLRAAESSNRASQTATEGAAVVQATLHGMQNIALRVQESARTVAHLGERSDQIGAIVGTIEDIADQTNLLALNAAIEAARAGDQGRGFAVVADEVRALAERTSRATREIGEMIRSIQAETSGAVGSMELGVREVEKGMETSRKSGDALQDILGVISDLTEQIHRIATAAEEQTAVTGEISANIHDINGIVSETAKGAHETASAATHLTTLAAGLQQMVGRFKLA